MKILYKKVYEIITFEIIINKNGIQQLLWVIGGLPPNINLT